MVGVGHHGGMGDGHSYWAWRDDLVRHPDGRASGGEPCVKCGEPVPANAHWKHRDRHVCSPRCNLNLWRQVTARLRRGDEMPIPTLTTLPDPRSDPTPQLFGMSESSEPGALPFQFFGFGPRDGDVIERFGVSTHYSWYRPEELPNVPEFAPYGLFGALHESGHVFLVAATEEGCGSNVTYGHVASSGEMMRTREPFSFGGEELVWRHEFISDLTQDGREYRWEATVCVPTTANHPGSLWSPSYAARSKSLNRISASLSRHSRRVRVDRATTERFDPFEVFQRDGWVCGLCGVAVDPEPKWPDPMSASLDHIKPLVAGGEHSRQNTQLAHWICNVRKGATWSGASLDLP